MRLAKKLQNPFALVAQGFVLGSLIFFGVQSGPGEARAADPAPQASILSF